MKVLQINNVYGYGSTGKIVGQIHDYLLKHDIDSYVIYSRKEPKNVNMKNVYRYYSSVGCALHAFEALLFDTHGLHSSINTKKIISKIEEIDPDIVHLHVIHGFYLNYKILFNYLKESHRKVIWTLHDCWQYTGYCAYYDYNECYEWENNKCEKCKYRNTYPYRLFSHSKQNFEIKAKCYDGRDMVLVSCSKWLEGEVSKSMLKDKKHIVINNSVDLSKFYYEPSDIKNRYGISEKKVILAVANVWTVQKGFNEYNKLARILDDEYVIVMVGLNDKQLNQIDKKIVGIKRVDINELRHWYSNSYVYLNCTLEDNYPTVNLEAKACGLPVITYRTGGSTEMVGTNGYVVDRYALDQVVDILNTKELVKKVEVNENDMCEEYLKLYKSC